MPRVLLIDDDQEFVADMHTFLARRCDLLVVSNLQSATNILKHTQVDFIFLRRNNLLDKQPALTKWLRKRKLAQIPVVILGENNSRTEWREILQAGLESLLKEPGVR